MNDDVFANVASTDPAMLPPQELLGVSDDASRDDVVAALKARLALLSARTDLPAQVVSTWRMALHAAALRLLMPLGATSGEFRQPPGGGMSSERGELREIDALAAVVLGMYGGWSPASMQHLRMLAHSAGIPEQQLLAYFAGPVAADARQHAARATAFGEAASSSQTLDVDVLPAPRVPLMRYVVIGAGVVVGVVVLALGLRIMTARPTRATPVAPPPGLPQAGPAVPSNAASAGAQASSVGASESRGQTLAAMSVADAIASLRVSAGGDAAKVREAWLAFAGRWYEADRATRVVGIDAAVERVYAESRGVQVVDSILSQVEGIIRETAPERGAWSPELVVRRSWALATAARLASERDLDRSVKLRLRDAAATFIATLPGQSADPDVVLLAACEFVAEERDQSAKGVTSGVSASQEEAAWNAWLRCVTQAASGESLRREGAVLRALERIVLRPKAEQRPHDPIALRSLVAAIDWSERGIARAAMVRWLGSAGDAGASLALVTSLVSQQAQAMLDPSFVLAHDAAEQDRRDLRGRLVRIWALSSPEQEGEFASKLDEVAGVILAQTPQDPLQELRLAAQLAALNAIAERCWRGEGDQAMLDLLAMPKFPTLGPALESAQAASEVTVTWGIEYAAAGADLSKRRQLLAGVNAPPSRFEAGILVREAARGPNADVRTAAQRALQRWIREREVRGALLDFVPFLPATPTSSKIVEGSTGVSLPPPRDVRWRNAVRRGLVQVALEESASPATDTDVVAGELRSHYIDRYHLGPQSTGGEAMTLQQLARGLVRQRLQRVRGELPGHLVDRHAELQRVFGRAEAESRNQVHGFVEAQSDLVRVLHAEVEIEGGCDPAKLAQIVTQWRESLRSARHVFQQVRGGEEAQLRLWLLRYACRKEGGA